MSESTSAPAPITTDHLARIKHDAQRGIGASSGDTLRLIADNERLASFESAYLKWSEKTEWVQESVRCSELGKHRADVMRDRINQLTDVNTRLFDQVKVLQSDANSWQSGYDEGRRMGTKTMQEARALHVRLAGFWRSPKEMPPEDAQVVVLRDAGTVGNGQHPGHRCGRWLELTTASRLLFTCDALSTGNVIGWVGADEFLGLEGLSANAWRYVWLRGKDEVTAAHFLGYSDGSVCDSVIDRAMSREAQS